MVKSVFLRHVLVETKEMARMALSAYMESTDEDPFSQIASSLSACALTRAEGGRIGWVDLATVDMNEATTTILPTSVLTTLWSLQPKSGDLHIISSTETNQHHLILAEELLLNHLSRMDGATKDNNTIPRVGSHSGQNALIARSKLRGQGVTPTFPKNPKTYKIHTVGCQMNVADSERLKGVFQHDLGMAEATDDKDADVVVFNTCSIRDHAEQKLYDSLGPYSAQKRAGRDVALIVTGCVAQQEGDALLRRVPEIDVVVGPQYVPRLRDVLDSVEWGHQVLATSPMIQQDRDFSKPVREHRVKAWVNVIYGCNEHCTYCVVPAVRGMEQSRTMESILEECLDLANNGYKEITLLGQNIDAYGRDMVPKRNFADLLVYLNANLPDGMRIRYVTSHPRYFADGVIDAVANLDKVCECFHMPFQAGDDGVLKRMRRGYTFESYMKIIDKIRLRAPDAAICGDVIVGFPGESDEAFEQTLALMREVKFDNLNTFAYSPRPNTDAALFEDQIAEEVKASRLRRVQALAAEHALERSKRYVGRTVEVLVEGRNPRNPEQVMGRTRQGRQIFFGGDIDSLEGKLVDVEVTEARTWSLMGRQASLS